MTGKELFQAIINGSGNRAGFWHGDPNPASAEKLFAYFGVNNDIELGLKLGSHCRWVRPESNNFWKTPPMLNFHSVKNPARPVFADTEDAAEIDAYQWPDPKNADFTETLAAIDKAVNDGQAVLSGTWSCFFHTACDFFGMQNLFLKMHEYPEVVDAVMRHTVDFYLAANEILFRAAGNKIDALFFGNDFGTQLDLLISPESFDRFIMPYFREFTEQAHRYGHSVVLHSCGAIDRVIPQFIEAGVDILHPIQAKARNMDAEFLAKKYRGKIVFMGGVDTQQLLPFMKPADVRAEVMRLKDIFGPNYIISPSHESILPDVPPENIAALAAAAAE